MAFQQNWIQQTLHCVTVNSLDSLPTVITAGAPADLIASIQTSDTIAVAPTLDPGDGSGAITAILTGPVNSIYTATFSHTYAAAGVYQAVISGASDSGISYEQEFQIIVN